MVSKERWKFKFWVSNISTKFFFPTSIIFCSNKWIQNDKNAAGILRSDGRRRPLPFAELIKKHKLQDRQNPFKP